MAHFFDATTYAPLLTCPIQVGEKKTVGLWGGDFFGNDLGVFIDQDLVKMQEKKLRQNNCRYFDITGVKSGQTNIRAFAGLYDYALPIEIKVTKRTATPQGKLLERKAIIDEALSHVGKAHYLWGGAGNTPGLADGANYRPDLVKMMPNSFNQTEPLVRTAFTTIQGTNYCAGNSDQYSQVSSQSIRDYLKEGKDQPGRNNLFPRLWKFQNEPKKSPKCANSAMIVWGESCLGKRHFDCIGFVNYCIGKVWWRTEKFAVAIGALFDSPTTYGFVIVNDPTDILNADLVTHKKGTGWEHIGMVYLDESKQAKVVQASESYEGVTKGQPYVASEWGRRIRLLDDMIRVPASPKY